MKIIVETSDYSEALVKKALLDQAGFFVHMDNFEVGSAMPHLGYAVGYRLVVADSDFDDALSVLRDAEFEHGEPLAPPDRINECPKCGSEDVVQYRSKLWLFVHWFIGVLLPAPGGNLRTCMKCGHMYKTKGPALTVPLKALIALVLVFMLSIWMMGTLWEPVQVPILHRY